MSGTGQKQSRMAPALKELTVQETDKETGDYMP